MWRREDWQGRLLDFLNRPSKCWIWGILPLACTYAAARVYWIVEVFLGLRALNETFTLLWIGQHTSYMFQDPRHEKIMIKMNLHLPCLNLPNLRSPSQTSLDIPFALIGVVLCRLLGLLFWHDQQECNRWTKDNNSWECIMDRWTKIPTVLTLALNSRCCSAMNAPLAERVGRSRSAVRHKRRRMSILQRTTPFTDA